MSKRLISILLFVLMAFVWFPGTFTSTLHAEDNHVIVGYGPVKGNLVFPKSVEIMNDQVFVLDASGVSVFSLSDQQFITLFPVEVGKTNTDRSMLGVYYWTQKVREQSYSLPLESFMKYNTLISNGLMVYPELETDGLAMLYVSGLNGITVMSSKGEIQRVIPYPEEVNSFDSMIETKTLIFHIIQGTPYLFIQTNRFAENKKLYYTYRLYLLSDTDEFSLILHGSMGNNNANVIDFTYFPNRKTLVVIGNGNIEAMDQQGKFFAIENLTPFFSFTQILLMEDGSVLLSCTDSSIGNYGYRNRVLSGMLSFDGKDPAFTQSWYNPDWGAYALDMCCTEDSIGIVSTGKIGSLLSFQVKVVKNGEQYLSIGKNAEDPGQLLGCFAYAVDENGNLYTNNLGSSTIQVFSPEGIYQNSIPIDRSVVTPAFGYCLNTPYEEFTPFITDMTISDHDLYITNLIPNTICRYNLLEKKWRRLYEWSTLYEEKTPDTYDFHFWIKMQVVDDTVYLLDPKPDRQGMPQLFYLNANHALEPVVLPKTDEFDPVEIYFFTDFTIQNSRLLILDGMYNNLYQWDFPNPSEVKRMHFDQHGKGGFYSSFCITESGHYIVTDPVHDRLHKINQYGEEVEEWGETSELTIGDTRDHYLTDPTAFHTPLRVKANHNTLYISDFMNNRFHIQPMPQNVPEINVTDFVYFDGFEVFHDLDFTIPIEIISNPLIHFQVETSQNWIKIKDPNITSESTEIHITLLGGEMKPWANNYGYLYIKCDEADLNYNKKTVVDISVDTVGIKIQLTIDDSIPLYNDKPQPALEAAPFIIKGRTMVPVRFIGESFGASITWDASTKDITIGLGDLDILLQTNNPIAKVNGKEVKMDVPLMIINGRTFVPLRFISEAFGAKVDYDNATRKITILYPAPET